MKTRQFVAHGMKKECERENGSLITLYSCAITLTSPHFLILYCELSNRVYIGGKILYGLVLIRDGGGNILAHSPQVILSN